MENGLVKSDSTVPVNVAVKEVKIQTQEKPSNPPVVRKQKTPRKTII
jgi:hypothetical protein